jgi:hypothetical protein
MRRELLTSFVVTLLFIAAGCGGEKKALGDSASSAPNGGTLEGRTPTPLNDDCIPDESGGDRTCGNLLPISWASDLDTLHARLQHTAVRDAVDSVTRESKPSCAQNGGNPRKTLGILLQAPVAMDSFPRTGTGTRELVTSLLNVKRDERCEEKRYGVLRFRGNSRESYEFIATSTGAASAPDGTDKPIGKWTSWSLSWKTNGPKQYVLLELTSGRFVQCGHVHPQADGDVAFISCPAARRASDFASRTTSPDSAFRSIIAGVMRRGSTALALTRADPLTDPAWGRCGSLGCCSSETAAPEASMEASKSAK